ncbi:cellobiose phosphorylase [Paenibacillus sp. MSJ-34]|uniref:GH36-type glycosyl hydrolase domain-containing protein n=1 Tax=Paenibacillus sp. MSJ-34 TaxID=2841529 RepID=UPI001C121A51|nr:cellobiose phosphorylase [Paenibacillus sp. MSJ-34]MBU5444830.1 cellobiose phosphorylase [Paenibacillus sp. MSJ-34]
MTTLLHPNFHVKAGDLEFTFLNSGDIREIRHNDTMINQWIANPIDGSLNNIYLRLHRDTGIKVVPLLGVHSGSEVRYTDTQVIWEGTAESLSYRVTFTLTPQSIWFWDVQIEGSGAEVDILYGQDLGLAHKGAVRSNEAYLSQYIDHAVFEDETKGYVVCSRQNQPQQGIFPYMQQGALTKAIGYSTDGFQFFGLSYKESNEPAAFGKERLDNEVYQYEFAYTALQSERVTLDGKAQFVFYGLFRPDHPQAIASLEFAADVAEAWNQANGVSEQAFTPVEPVHLNAKIGAPLQTEAMTIDEIDRLFPDRRQEERQDGELLAFFTGTHEHVVLKAKEMLVERPHGHIIMTGNNARLNDQVLTSTSYMYGIFNSQLVVGNTSNNKMITNARNALNVMKTSGQRIYVERDGQYRLLTMPSMFEMGFNYSRWYYKTADDTLVITNFTTVDTPEIHLQVRSESGKSYRWLVTKQVIMNNNEYDAPFHMEQAGPILTFTADAASDSAKTLPSLCYRMQVEGSNVSVKDESALAAGVRSGDASLVVLELSESSAWTMTVQGSIHGEARPFVPVDADAEAARYRAFYEKVMNGFRLSRRNGTGEEFGKINALAWWYTHNMLVHYSVPHGLEQYGGAAWGTRDVCQGPTEYFLATQKYDAVREILLAVYSHQYADEGNWPQWFMFDRYYRIQQEESHGDIIVWPLKVLGDYLIATRDYSILTERVPYTDRHSFEFTEERAAISDHVAKEIDYMKRNFLHDTFLSSYGDGDWDDTLQPANPQLKQYLISSWTVALTYQVFRQLSDALAQADQALTAQLRELASGIQADFQRYMLQTDVIPGFVYMEEPGQAKLMLHPTDAETGIQYRLLPMTRSIISELLDEKQAAAHYDLIKRELYCPDGVRLMNRPAQYAGGVSTHFKRAEQAANFGREVGLQYVHAHIRFVEAMAKLGKAEEAWKGLETINPIGLRDAVPNAELRQSNAYFSSSDGKFNNRYEAQERFGELRQGKVAVKGGWRIYSSGPGIYMNQLISNCLGIRHEGDDLIVDPVLPQDCDGLQFDFKLNDVPVRFVYRVSGQPVRSVTINGQQMESIRTANRYRQGGLRIRGQELARTLSADANEIVIEM